MKDIKTVSLIGLGAIGCAYLGRIAESVPIGDIRVLASGERAERYRKDGVTINGRRYDFPVYDPSDRVEPADLLIFAVKYNQLAQAVEDAKGHVGPDTIVLSLLNGITSEEIIGRAYGPDKLLYSLVIGIDAVRVGGETTYTKLGNIPFGEAENPPGAYSEKVRRVQSFFERTGVPYTVEEDMLHALWRKFMFNVGLNQVSAVLRSPYGALRQEGEPRSLVMEAMREAVTLARKEGVRLSERDIEDCLSIVGTLSPLGKTSMLQDVEAGRETEVEIFSGAILQLAGKHGVAVPVNEMLYRLIRGTEAVSSFYKGINA